jgi:translation initiation factor 5B
MERGLNAALYYDNLKTEDLKSRISIIPTSAHTGEGIPDMLLLLVQLTQQMMAESLMFSSVLQCTILEVKVIEGLGTTIDCILVNGVLHRGDTIVVCGVNGPVVTQVRELLTPQPMKEMRIKGEYVHHAEIEAAMGVKILANDLENSIAGTSIWQVGADDDVEEIKEAAMGDIDNVMDSIPKNAVGVHVQASTLGALEALLEFLNPKPGRQGCDPPIPVSGCSIGPVFKKDVLKASLQLKDNPEYGLILAFDVPVKAEAEQMAKELKVQVFTADIIYHLFDKFTAHMDALKEKKREEMANVAIFPSICRILPNCIFNKKDPIVLGVHVEEGILKVGTILCVPEKDGFIVGTVTGLESNHKPVNLIKKGNDVAVSISASDSSTMYGRQFSHENKLYSKLTRESIDMLKLHFRKDLGKEDWKLVIKLKKGFGII